MATATRTKTTDDTATKNKAAETVENATDKVEQVTDKVANATEKVAHSAVADFEEVSADFEEAAGRVRDLNEEFAEVVKHVGNVTLDAGEKSLHLLLDFQRKAAEATEMDAVTAMSDAQIKVVSDMANLYTQTVRDFLK